jgi:predicted TIM-barrel fold metal-dependent hydrolase
MGGGSPEEAFMTDSISAPRTPSQPAAHTQAASTPEASTHQHRPGAGAARHGARALADQRDNSDLPGGAGTRTSSGHGSRPPRRSTADQLRPGEQLVRFPFPDGSESAFGAVIAHKPHAAPGHTQFVFKGIASPNGNEPHTDAHFHPSNYVQRGVAMPKLLKMMDEIGLRYTTAMPIPTSLLSMEGGRTVLHANQLRYPQGREGHDHAGAHGETDAAHQHHCGPLESYYVPEAIVNELKAELHKGPNENLSTQDWLDSFDKHGDLIDRIVAKSELYVDTAVNDHLAKSIGSAKQRAAHFAEIEDHLAKLTLRTDQRKEAEALVKTLRTEGVTDANIQAVDSLQVRLSAVVPPHQQDTVAKLGEMLRHSGLTDAQRDRIDPMITGLHLGDPRVGDKLLGVLADNPGVFTGIGEITIHKELVEEMFAGQRGQASARANKHTGEPRLMPLINMLEIAGVVGLPATIHCDIDSLREQVDDRTKRNGDEAAAREPSNFAGLQAFFQHPRLRDTRIVWAHGGGLGRFVQEGPHHLNRLTELLHNCPNLRLDISWSEVAKQLTRTPEAMNDWKEFLETNSKRIMFGSDSLAPRDIDTWGQTKTMYEALFNQLSPDTRDHILNLNYENTFVLARSKVREFENNVLTPSFVAAHVTNLDGADGQPAQPIEAALLREHAGRPGSFAPAQNTAHGN